MSEYVPRLPWPHEPTAIVQEALREYVGDGEGEDEAVLAAHDAQVLRDAANEYRSGQLTGVFLGRDDYPRAWLNARAEQIEKGADQ